jgi:hypothetical protein
VDRAFASNNSKPIRFIKIDGFYPTNKNVVEGKYRMWAEMVQVGTPPTDPLLVDMLANLGSANQVSSLNFFHSNVTSSKSGFLGTANNTAFLPSFNAAVAPGALANAAYEDVRTVNPYTHDGLTAGTLDHCRAPTIPAGNRALPAFYANTP